MYEEDSSVASSYGDQDEMDHFLNRCSICFESHLDMCLDRCKDQFCIDCFQRYIIEVVKSSWGLSVTPISCPVCNESIPKHEWTRYVPQSIVDTYEKFNKPYRSYVRSCPHCETDIIPCSHQEQIIPSTFLQKKIFCDLIKQMLDNCSKDELHKCHTEHIAVKRWISVYKREDWSVADLPVLYKKIMKDVTTFEREHTKSNNQFGKQISLQFMTLCVKPEIWKEVQFAHINFFPDMQCSGCDKSICLHCGYDSHSDISCTENMQIISRSSLDKEMRKTVKWKLQNSRQCPKCSIMINRDEGCNKVDCSYCGFAFCWACQSPWSEGCGFYRCSVLPNNSNNSTNNSKGNSNGITEEKTELGVPNIKNIQARINSSSNNNNNNNNNMPITTPQHQQIPARHLFFDEN